MPVIITKTPNLQQLPKLFLNLSKSISFNSSIFMNVKLKFRIICQQILENCFIYNMEDGDLMDKRIRDDKKLNIKFDLGQKIGEGCFGKIYKAISKISKNQVALKIQMQEDLYNRRSNLIIQVSILDKLKGVQGVPKVYSSGKWQYGYYLEMELLTSSLQDEKDKQFSSPEIQLMTCELINILKRIHAKNIIHQDLKPQNIMRNSKGSLVIIDFGLSTILPLNYMATISKQKKRGFIGTPRYASIAAHQGTVQTPKDDIQSLFYVIGYLIKKRAPWFQLKAPISERLEKIQKLKTLTSTDWFQQMGTSYATAYEYVRNLDSHQQIDYQYIINLFHKNRKTMMSKLPQKTQKVDARRRSDNLKGLFFDVPMILTKGNFNKHKTYSKEEIEVRESANFSTTAHDNCLEVIQLLAEKLIFEQEQDTDTIGNASEGLTMKDLSKYKGIDFKNPFEEQNNKVNSNC